VRVPSAPAPCYVVSDAHLGYAHDDVERSLIDFFESLAGRAGSLMINGDLFEFWFEWRTVIPRSAYRVLAALHRLRERGISITLVAGNHDCWGGEVLRDDVGIDYVLGPWDGMLGGWRTHVEHGDGLRGREDRKYRALRRVLRNRLAIRAFRLIHPDLATSLAMRSSHASRTYAARDGGRGLRDVGSRMLATHPDVELVVYAHSHVPALERMSRTQVYANAGSWLSDRTFLRVTPEQIELRRWDGSPDGVYLDGAHRVAQEALP
jgi:UDP-2,3-diacylglucosamine hydrolase